MNETPDVPDTEASESGAAEAPQAPDAPPVERRSRPRKNAVHWLVRIAERAGLVGEERLDIPPETDASDAWRAVSESGLFPSRGGAVAAASSVMSERERANPASSLCMEPQSLG